MSNVHHLAASDLTPVEPISAVFAKPSPFTDRCTRHAWLTTDREQGHDFRTCTRCGTSYDQLEAELHDANAQILILGDEVNEQEARADRAEESAKLNAETIEAQRKAIRKLESELAIAKAKAAHKVLHGDLKAAILEFALTNLEHVVFIDGDEPVRAWTLWEQEQFSDLSKHLVAITSGGVIPRMVCPGCHDADCEGCQDFDVSTPVLPRRLLDLLKECRRG